MDNEDININSFIDEKEINKFNLKDDIKIEILNKKEYIKYEIFEISVTNNSKEDIAFNTKSDINSIYLEDLKGLKYVAFLNEISNYDLNILKGQTKKYNIKFNKVYDSETELNKIVFTNIKKGKNLIDIEIEL